MRKQIAAANWKMNLTVEQAQELLKDILDESIELGEFQQVLFAVPFPYLTLAGKAVDAKANYAIAAQNCYHQVAGAYTGEVSVEMLASLGINYCLVGHSERREYFKETNHELATKIDLLLVQDLTPVFCCGEPLEVRESGEQNKHVEQQLVESLFHLRADQVTKVIIAYEPVWAIGTGKTATTAQAQEMHAYLRSVIEGKYGKDVAEKISILYGGSVKANNAKELFSSPDVDGGLVGGASLMAQEFVQIIKALQ